MMGNIGIILTLALAVIFTFIAVAAFVASSANGVQQYLALYKNRFTESANTEMSDMFVTMDPMKLFLLNIVLLVALPLVAHSLFQLWVITGGVFAVCLILPGIIWRKLRNKRLSKLEAQLPDAFLMISSSLQSGASLNMALEDMVKQSQPPLSQEFSLLIKRMKLGVPLEEGLVEMEKRLPLASFVMASSAVRISREVGGNLVDTISNMANTLRRKHTMEGKIDSLTAQGRAQGRFMGALPIFLAIGLSFIEPEAMNQLYTTRVGLIILAIMVGMQVAGFVFIRKITTIDS
ncbi:MAG: type II secretion system F family protein [Pseudomonadota bacterium]